jgi:pectinesterase
MRIVLSGALMVMLVCVAMGGDRQLRVTNPAPFDRHEVTVEVPWERLEGIPADRPAVFENSRRLVSQTIDVDGDGIPEVLLFRASFGREESKVFTIREDATPVDGVSQTDVKYVLPRKDVAWENDRIAFRIYGSELAGDVLNGIDVWVKRVRHHVIDTWYGGDSLKGKARVSYHVDHGEGADFFTVGKSLGCGSTALWADGIVEQSGLFTSYRIIATGPIRLMFFVGYEKQSSTGVPFREEKIVSLDAGCNLNRIDVSYPGMTREGALAIATGLVKRPNTTKYANEAEGWVSLWGPTNDDSANGELGTGIVIPPETFRGAPEDSLHCYVLGMTTPERTLTYYTGAGWTGSGDVATVEEWNEFLRRCARELKFPLRLDVMAR